MNGNEITIVGNLTRDPELKYSAGGQAICSMGVAVSRRWKDRSDAWQEATSFFDVTAWGDLGEHCAESLLKGARVVASGRMEQRSWETDDGQKRYAWNMIADEIGPSLRWATATVTRTEREKYDTKGPARTDQPPDNPPPGDNPDPF